MSVNFFELLIHHPIILQVNRDPQMVMDIINEEETQFLKTLTRGRDLLERTIAKLEGKTTLPGKLSIQECYVRAV